MFNQLVKLFICSSVLLSSTGLVFATAQPTQASEQSDQLWKKYLSGRMVIHDSPGGRTVEHFCSNATYSSANGNGSNALAGTWQIFQSEVVKNTTRVIVQITFSNGKIIRNAFVLKSDKKLYTFQGEQLVTGNSTFCR
jgi:hypothetical protein